MIEMKVAGIVLNAASRSPMILLKDSLERRALPIFIGQDQADAIIKALEGNRPSRPLTHDLVAHIFDDCDIKLEKVIIHSLTDDIFYAVLCIESHGVKKEIDCRPSDAVAIALRTDSPIWVLEEVIADASIPVDRDADDAERQAFKQFVSSLSPETLIKKGGYKEKH
ncbi:bifunctional nuclease family protein [Waterburya agarophytonicola K14]|uniref:Bifunctional nuclease family protein n=1 Tax=Waterburya agarophytonicola KI4 TaxID=2874699 RepID=A0A964FHE2_9CYAN|nr:bifunctional nuclease family protein [Waterburya agarophytonicola]MCC0177569.1 bifunctional nuclease family protein [Waterburya agarophytonicola KI4]